MRTVGVALGDAGDGAGEGGAAMGVGGASITGGSSLVGSLVPLGGLRVGLIGPTGVVGACTAAL